jgi:alkanesulfonate monooxygenase
MAKYVQAGVDEFIVSGYPHVEEAFWFAEGVTPLLRERGLSATTARHAEPLPSPTPHGAPA